MIHKKEIRMILLLGVCSLFSGSLFAQVGGPVSVIRGGVTDGASGQPMSYVAVVLDNTTTGATTGDDGTFTINNVPVGRHTVLASFIGYEMAIMKEILVGSAREVYLEIKLTEKPMELDEVVVRPKINKAAALNEMATLGARVFSVEEASRYAGGMDDPARLASGFAGVTTEAVNNNGISIHGNSPSLLQWRIEGVEVSNVNHFADITQAGGGFLSALSSNVVGNSDFFTGAFPAEYGNAVAGVFDMRLRNGNSQKYQHAFQFGIQGIDFASEGPVSKKNNASYIINYRYSTIGILEKMSDMEESMNFLDVNFKLNFPTRKAGTFSLWGMGLIDNISALVDEPAEWQYRDDGIASAAKLASGATGLSHKYLFGNNKTSLLTTLAATLQNM
ncbi:MAG: carboxypeptidase-like regulatory domain-containing protein, partial [Tannerellaceae bacterium]|nr:carboxypeptidase-like regulatory domain-containing protein [Tannerellaceae bacterium]